MHETTSLEAKTKQTSLETGTVGSTQEEADVGGGGSSEDRTAFSQNDLELMEASVACVESFERLQQSYNSSRTDVESENNE